MVMVKLYYKMDCTTISFDWKFESKDVAHFLIHSAEKSWKRFSKTTVANASMAGMVL